MNDVYRYLRKQWRISFSSSYKEKRPTQQSNTYSKSAIKTLEKDVKYVES